MKRNGFTLTELLVVVALMAILGVIIVPNIGKEKAKREFDITVEKIVFALNQARDRAIVWENATTWGVVFRRRDPGCSGLAGPPRFEIYYTNGGYSANPPKLTSTYVLPVTIAYTATSSWETYCNRVISFKEITGELNYLAGSEATSSVKLYMIKNPAVSSTISVSRLGVVSYTTSTLSAQ